MKYKQCKLTKKTETGTVTTVGYIESEHAKVGVRMTLEDMEGIWTVKEVGASADMETLEGQRKAQKRWESVIK